MKQDAGVEHVPSGNFQANSAWQQYAALARKPIHWTAILRDIRIHNLSIVTRTIRTRHLAAPGRLVNRSGPPIRPMSTTNHNHSTIRTVDPG